MKYEKSIKASILAALLTLAALFLGCMGWQQSKWGDPIYEEVEVVSSIESNNCFHMTDLKTGEHYRRYMGDKSGNARKLHVGEDKMILTRVRRFRDDGYSYSENFLGIDMKVRELTRGR